MHRSHAVKVLYQVGHDPLSPLRLNVLKDDIGVDEVELPFESRCKSKIWRQAVFRASASMPGEMS
jgi:hypothetical protein